MYLNATFSASPFDDHYQMALIYCFDQDQNYCFSLSRFPGENEIEVMVLDQVNRKVSDLSVVLEGSTLNIALDDELAAQLDGHGSYTICLIGIEARKLETLRDALRKIFEGKHGLRIEG
ncbi:transcriptional repressor [Rugamonas aquatica]|uniref:Transcriptional repressor n=1 Tax=Rugamonas aquatica TaxID=2743357 RepID=A0A6A7N1H7_9BURK|nr:transcriptional repressor [Rugamonas aquatica]MQA38821.1 transcriptional repressor [Rugamonas aquatica]